MEALIQVLSAYNVTGKFFGTKQIRGNAVALFVNTTAVPVWMTSRINAFLFIRPNLLHFSLSLNSEGAVFIFLPVVTLRVLLISSGKAFAFY